MSETITPKINNINSKIEILIETIRKRVIEWEKRNWVPYPWRVERTPYKVLLAELLLKRTTRKAVAREFPKFMAKFRDINAIYNASLSELNEALKHLGLYRQRASQLKELAKIVVERYGGRIPDTWDELLSLPGLGAYIAGAVLSFGYGKRAPVVDSNVIRLLSRLTGLHFKKAEDCLPLMWILVPSSNHEDFNYGMIDLGAIVCHYREPKCQICPLSDLCVFQAEKIHKETATLLRNTYMLLIKQNKDLI